MTTPAVMASPQELATADERRDVTVILLKGGASLLFDGVRYNRSSRKPRKAAPPYVYRSRSEYMQQRRQRLKAQRQREQMELKSLREQVATGVATGVATTAPT